MSLIIKNLKSNFNLAPLVKIFQFKGKGISRKAN